MAKHFIGPDIARQVGPNNLVEMICRDGANTLETSRSNLELLRDIEQSELDERRQLMMNYFLGAIRDGQIVVVGND